MDNHSDEQFQKTQGRQMEPGVCGTHHVCCCICVLAVDPRLLGDCRTQAWEAQAQVACRSLATGCLSFSNSGAHAVRLYRMPSSLQPQEKCCSVVAGTPEGTRANDMCKSIPASKSLQVRTPSSPLCYDTGGILQCCLSCIALQLCPKLVIGHGDQQTLDDPSNILQVHEALHRWPAAPCCTLLHLIRPTGRS